MYCDGRNTTYIYINVLLNEKRNISYLAGSTRAQQVTTGQLDLTFYPGESGPQYRYRRAASALTL